MNGNDQIGYPISDHRLAYLYLILACSEGQDQNYTRFDCKYLVNGNKYEKRFDCHTDTKYYTDVRMAYLHLILTHSKGQGQGQGQGRAHFDYDYLGNGDG